MSLISHSKFYINVDHNAPVKQRRDSQPYLQNQKTFQSHAQEALDMLAIDYSADRCLAIA